MGQYTDWFIASEEEAEALATAEDAFEGRWPHLSLKDVLLLELDALFCVLTGDEDSHLLGEVYMSPQLRQQEEELAQLTPEEASKRSEEMTWEGVVVARVHPELIARLARLTPQDEQRLAQAWKAREELEHLEPEYTAQVLGELVRFAQQATGLKQPVLELQVL